MIPPIATLFKRLRGFLAPPRITTLEQINAPFALPKGRTPVRIVTQGSGLLRIDDVRMWVAGEGEHILKVRTATTIRAHLKNLRGEDVMSIKLDGLQAQLPTRLRLPHDAARFKDLGPVQHDSATFHLFLKTPMVSRHRTQIPTVARWSPTPLANGAASLPIARTIAMRPNVEFGLSPRKVGADAQSIGSQDDDPNA